MEKNWNDRIEFEELIVDRYEGEKAARKYLADNRRKRKIKKVITGVIDTVIVISAVGIILTHCTSNKEVPASTKAETETTTEVPTEEETTTETVKVEKECLVTDVVGSTITIECEDNLYSFYGDGYAKGQTVICTFEGEKITDASEPIITEEPEEIKFFDVTLSEDIQLHIMAECEKYNIAPALIIAMIERESNFDQSAVGDNGNSLGLMQIQPRWHQWRMDAIGGGGWLNPYDNTAVGISIVADLFNKYGDNVYMVLMEYNGGASYAKKMSNKGIVSDYASSIVERASQLEAEAYGGQ